MSLRRRVIAGAALAALALGSAAVADNKFKGWRLVDTFGPMGRTGHAMAYDAARSVTVLFGGVMRDTREYSDETWKWDGVNWVLEADTGPSPRAGHAMAYDSRRGVTVLFGGRDTDGRTGETWEWDGNVWKRRDVPGPAPRAGHEMAYDSRRGVTVLFGGSVDGPDDRATWEWDGNIWMMHDIPGPPSLTRNVMAYDSRRSVTVLVGGRDDEYEWPWWRSETWEWDGGVWRQRDLSHSWIHDIPRAPRAMVYDSARGVTVVVADPSLSQYWWYNATFEWNGNGWRTQCGGFRDNGNCPNPSKVTEGYAMAYDAARGVTVLTGGLYSGRAFYGTWEYGAGGRGACGGTVKRFKAETWKGDGKCKIEATVNTTLPHGTKLTLCFEDAPECGCQTVAVNRHRATAKCATDVPGEHRVYLQECPRLVRDVTCESMP